MDINFKEIVHLSPALRWWTENLQTLEIAVRLLGQNSNDIENDPRVQQALKQSKIKPKTFLAYLEILKRYLAVNINFWE